MGGNVENRKIDTSGRCFERIDIQVGVVEVKVNIQLVLGTRYGRYGRECGRTSVEDSRRPARKEYFRSRKLDVEVYLLYFLVFGLF